MPSGNQVLRLLISGGAITSPVLLASGRNMNSRDMSFSVPSDSPASLVLLRFQILVSMLPSCIPEYHYMGGSASLLHLEIVCFNHYSLLRRKRGKDSVFLQCAPFDVEN